MAAASTSMAHRSAGVADSNGVRDESGVVLEGGRRVAGSDVGEGVLVEGCPVGAVGESVSKPAAPGSGKSR